MFEKGKFRLRTAALGILSAEGERAAIEIPCSSIVDVVSHTKGDRLVDVLWDGKAVTMFAQDIRERTHAVSPRESSLHSAVVCEENLRALTEGSSTGSNEPIPIRRVHKSRRDR